MIRLNQEQREAIGRAVLEILGTTPERCRVYPGGIVGMHTSSDVIAVTVLVPCSWIDGRRSKAATVQRKDVTP